MLHCNSPVKITSIAIFSDTGLIPRFVPFSVNFDWTMDKCYSEKSTSIHNWHLLSFIYQNKAEITLRLVFKQNNNILNVI